MLIKSALLTDASGSIGGMTASRNKGGLYLRSRVVPTNPNSSQQQTLRTAMSDLANRWNDTLTQAQRDDWDTYADNVTLPNALGDQKNVSGIAMYIRSNVPRIQIGSPIVDAGPTVFNLGSFTEPVITATAPSSLSVVFLNSDLWANEDDSSMQIFASRGQNPAIKYFKGPYRLAGTIAGDAGTPPTSPAAITAPFVLTAGQIVFLKVNVTRADGRYASTFRGEDLVA